MRTNILRGIPDRDRKDAITSIMASLLMNGITTVNAMEGGFMYSDKDANFYMSMARSFL